MQKNKLAHLALILVNLIYGLNYTIAKDVMNSNLHPSGFVFLRVFFACLLFFIIKSIWITKEVIDKKDYFLLMLCGLFGVTINQLFFFNGLNLTTEINASIIMTTNPILVLTIALLIKQERFSIIKLLGIVLGCIGAISIILNGENTLTATNISKGNVMIFVNAFSYALYLILVKNLMKKYSFITVIFYVFLFGFIFVFPFGIKEVLTINPDIITTSVIIGILYVVIFTTFLAYLLNIFSLTYLKSSVVSSYIYLQPIFAALFAILFQVDVINAKMITPTILIFLGVYLVSTKKI